MFATEHSDIFAQEEFTENQLMGEGLGKQTVTKMRKKSIGINTIVSGIRTIVALLFPLITTPYIARVLEVNNVGKVNFSLSIVSYYSLLAGLGISGHAVREGARYKEDKEKFSVFFSEIFVFNLITTAISYIALFIMLWGLKLFSEYEAIILILSLNIILATIGCEWVYTVYEEYIFIAIRGLVVQLISFLLLFATVKTKDDVLKYAFMMVVSNTGANLANLFCLRKYCSFVRIKFSNILKHLKPCLMLFASAVTCIIYVTSDVTILGLISGDYYVGLYTISGKFYSIMKTVLATIITVSVPRLSLFRAQDDMENFAKLANKVRDSLMIFLLPAIVGMLCLSPEFVICFASQSFAASASSLRILCIALFFCMLSWFYNSCVLIPCRQDYTIIIETAIAAITNIVLNFLLIPYFNENAAAFTTLIAEAITMFYGMHFARKIVKINWSASNLRSILAGCCYVLVVCLTFKALLHTRILIIMLSVLCCVTGYFLILLLLKNEYCTDYMKRIIVKLKHGN